jgi:hypothetical protein
VLSGRLFGTEEGVLLAPGAAVVLRQQAGDSSV